MSDEKPFGYPAPLFTRFVLPAMCDRFDLSRTVSKCTGLRVDERKKPIHSIYIEIIDTNPSGCH